MIQMDHIPTDILRPGIWVEIDPTLAFQGLPVFRQRVVIFGQLGSGASAAALVPLINPRPAEAQALFGAGMLPGMVTAFRAANPHQELVVVPVADLEAGQAATGTVSFSGPASRGGTVFGAIANRPVTIGVTSGENAPSLASRFADVVNNMTALPVKAVANGADVKLTANWKGETGNDIDVSFNLDADQHFPSGVSASIKPMEGGTGNPDVSMALAVLDDVTQYQGFVTPWTDAANLRVLEDELARRWQPLQAIDGRYVAAKRGTLSVATTFLGGRNTPHGAVAPVGDSPTPTWEWASALCGMAIYYGSIHPARPLQNLVIPGARPPKSTTERWDGDEWEAILRAGGTMFEITPDGQCVLKRMPTLYKTSASGADDPSMKDIEVQFTMSYYRRSVVNYWKLHYPRHCLAADGHPADDLVVTPTLARGEMIAHYELMTRASIMQDLQGYKASLQVEKASTRGRVNVLERPMPMDQFRQLAIRSAFRL